MPNIKSAKKRVLVNEKKNERNTMLMSELRTAIKKFNSAIDSNNLEVAEQLLPETMSIIDKAATKGIITKSSADNRKARLSKKLSDIKSGKKEVVIKKDNKTIAAEKRAAKLAKEEAAKAEAKRIADEKKAAAEAELAAAKKTTKKTAKKDAAKDAAKEEKPKRSKAKKSEE